MKFSSATLAVLAMAVTVEAFSVRYTPPPAAGVCRAALPRRGGLALAAKRKGDLFQEIAELEGESTPAAAAPAEGGVEAAVSTDIAVADKSKAMLAPEETFFEGAPSWTEVVIPAISILTVVGIIPFAFTIARQLWVRFKITSRRISVVSGIGGKDLTEITYDEIYEVKYIFRAFGSVGDMVIELRDGAKLEMRSVPNFPEVYRYIMDKVDPEVKAASTPMSDDA
mmetsp:Transcript_5005/g.10180  ORF Transcript_5005/g.10180 Transcript_5005/m.10180 type:complete len:225 (-) Transcript_5005:192-866(-)|eukprot:CAMPEP_0182523252 /NCGR_PEP_ID=MMETSP1323-20130603/900_1 /TAXON_ID=236787 /ORGANISM="Florenciella parvula, Strain RCC1693" /LENGTH=224 /DNA_ID=CAMNT_0024731569 /DNA_START=42 /DNA_END=716 /DNA_ORIENTATION=-